MGHCYSFWGPSLVTCQEEGPNVTSSPDRTLGVETLPWQIDFTWRWHSLLQKMTSPKGPTCGRTLRRLGLAEQKLGHWKHILGGIRPQGTQVPLPSLESH